jgi:hypothetical protein
MAREEATDSAGPFHIMGRTQTLDLAGVLVVALVPLMLVVLVQVAELALGSTLTWAKVEWMWASVLAGVVPSVPKTEAQVCVLVVEKALEFTSAQMV